MHNHDSSLHKRTFLFVSLVIIIVAIATGILSLNSRQHKQDDATFSGDRALAWVNQQCAYGYRFTGSVGNQKTAEMISRELKDLGWRVNFQEFLYMGTNVRNILAWRGEGDAILLGAHYDTRRMADRENSTLPIMGANDGASGVAVLLELARVLNVEQTNKMIYLAFFDAEDNGKLDGWEWIVGSTFMANHWGESGESPLQKVIVVDMIGDQSLTVYMEGGSDPELSNQIWQTAQQLGYSEYFIPYLKYTILDDHIPFKSIGVPAVDIIDIEYPYWHTTQDTPDKISAESLEIVGTTLQSWLESTNQ